MADPDPSNPTPTDLIDALFERVLDRLELVIDLAAAPDRLAQLGLLANACRELADLSAVAVVIGREETRTPRHLPLDF